MGSSDLDLETGLGNGGSNRLEDGHGDNVSYDREVNMSHDGGSCSNSSSSGEVAGGNVELLIDKSSGDEDSQEHIAFQEKKFLKGKHKKFKTKRPPKPPLPPKGPSLDAADMRLIRELSEIAFQKRMRVEQMKELRKMRAARTQSSSKSSNTTTIIALIITIVFCVIIIIQGLCSRSNSGLRFQKSPEPVAANEGGFISIQFPNNISPSESNRPPSKFLINVSEIYSSGPKNAANEGAA